MVYLLSIVPNKNDYRSFIFLCNVYPAVLYLSDRADVSKKKDDNAVSKHVFQDCIIEIDWDILKMRKPLNKNIPVKVGALTLMYLIRWTQ